MVKTYCKDCVFNKKEGDVQVGCEIKNIEKATSSLEDGNMVLDRFCTGFRPQHWVDDVGTSDKAKLIELAKIEMIAPVNYAIIFEDNIEDLKKTLASIRAIENKNPRSTLTVINKKVEFNEEIYSLINQENFIKDRIYLVYVIDQEINVVDQAFKNMINGYAAYVYAGYEFPNNFVNKINEFTNIDFGYLYTVHDERKLLFNVKIFNFLGGNKKDEKNHSSFLEKVKAENSLKVGVYDWKEFFNE